MNIKKNAQKSNEGGFQSGSIIFIIVLIFCNLVSLSGCKEPKKIINDKRIQKVKIGYLPKGINPNQQISNCDYILDYKETFKDTIIIDKTFFRKLAYSISKLEHSSREVSYDFRIMCLILIEGDTIPYRLCLGEDHLVVFEGSLMKDDSVLFNLLNKTLYNK